MDLRSLHRAACEVLKRNWKDYFTVPSPKLYPHQWSWDSSFVAIGYSHYDEEKGVTELLRLFDAQWKNGMIPHIVFTQSAGGYFPGPEFYESHIAELSPRNYETSCFTQPPLQTIAVFDLYSRSSDLEKRLRFLEEIYPKLFSYHNFLLTERDPEKSGLATIIHPWESGLDDSPRWNEALRRVKIDVPLRYERKDLKNVRDPKERPSTEYYDRFIYLLVKMKQQKFDMRSLYGEWPFKLKDVVFNSILYSANQKLLALARIVKAEASQINQIMLWLQRTRSNFHRYFYSNEDGLFYDFDLVSGRRVARKTVACFAPLYTDLLTGEQVQTLAKWMGDSAFMAYGGGTRSLIPSSSKGEVGSLVGHFFTDWRVDDMLDFKPATYWRGPIWINMNWLAHEGLSGYGQVTMAKALRDAVLSLIAREGFWEYYDPFTGKGLGGNDFSWTAALTIDLLHK